MRTSPAREPVSAPTPRYRTELQGLRALAALLVVAYHVWFGRVSGGVDVFFLISGFLITGQLFRAGSRGGIRFRPLWGRMIKRLFPAALTVLLATVAVAVVVLPEKTWFSTAGEVVASAFYVENWRLALDAVDYFAQHDQASVVQQFWSLSVQGQFYLVWPLLVALVAWGARRAGINLRGSLVVALAVVFAVSLAYSVWLTEANQPLAYFSSLTRVWEFALGGLLALGIDMIALPRPARVAAGWLGIFGLVSCGLLLQVGTVFPGWVALWPTMSAVLVLVAGATGSAVGADRLLSTRPLMYLGNLSYGLYLWHWPVLVFTLHLTERSEAGLWDGALVVGLSLLLAVPTYHLIENPVRESNIGVTTRWGAYRFAALSLVPVLAAAGAWQIVAERKAEYTDIASPAQPGAEALQANLPLVNPEHKVVPPFAALKSQFDGFPDEQCRVSPRHEELRVCYVEPTGPPTRTIVVAGDSHSQQYVASLRPVVEERGWRVISMGKGACPLTTDSDTKPDDDVCRAWNSAVIEEIIDIEPDAVFTIGSRDVRVGLTEWTPSGYVAQWRKLDEAGIPVVAVRDNPRFDFSPPECVERHGTEAERCGVPRSQILPPEPPYTRLPDVPDNVSFIDFSDYLCTADRCPPIIGNVLVYMDNNHVTKAYMRTMSSVVVDRLSDVLGWHDTRVVAPGTR